MEATGGDHTVSGSVDDRRIAIALALAALAFVSADVLSRYAPNTWINRDGRFYTNANVTIAEDFGLDQHRFAASWYTGKLGWNRNLDEGWSNVAVGRGGKHYPKHPILMPILSTPLYWAFGLIGTLLFNVLMFAVMAAGGYLFARAYIRGPPAALAVIGFLLATAVRQYAYDYHVDVLLLALFLAGLGALVTGRGMLAGVLIGLTVVIKPTCLMWMPSLALLAFDRRDGRALRRALVGGALVLVCFAMVNWWMYGRPWWTGYNRTLVVVNGAPQIASHADAFSVPFATGIRRVWGGAYGLRTRFTLLALAAPGLLLLARRRPLYALATVLAVTASLLVFAKYDFEGDRFHWPALAFLVPALGATLELGAATARAILRRARRTLRDPRTAAAFATAILAAGATAATLFAGPPLEQRIGRDPLVLGALALGRHGSLDLRADLPEPELLARMGGPSSPVARSRFGTFIARVSPAAVVLAAPFAAAGGLVGLVLLALLAVGVAAFAATRIAARASPPAVAAVVVAGALLLPGMADRAVDGGPAITTVALALLAIDLALSERFAWAAALAVLGAWVAGAPWLVVLSVIALAALGGRRTLARAGVSAAVALAVWGLVSLLWIGRPFATPDDFVLVRGLGGGLEASAVEPAFRLADLVHAAMVRGPEHGMLAVLALFVPGFALLAFRDRRAALAIAVTLASLALPAVASSGGGRWPMLTVVLLALPVATFVAAIASPSREPCAPPTRDVCSWRRSSCSRCSASWARRDASPLPPRLSASPPWAPSSTPTCTSATCPATSWPGST